VQSRHCPLCPLCPLDSISRPLGGGHRGLYCLSGLHRRNVRRQAAKYRTFIIITRGGNITFNSSLCYSSVIMQNARIDRVTPILARMARTRRAITSLLITTRRLPSTGTQTLDDYAGLSRARGTIRVAILRLRGQLRRDRAALQRILQSRRSFNRWDR